MKRRGWIIGGAALAVVVAGVLVLAWFLAPRGNAEDQALAYLQALADGDLAAVQATGVDVPATTASAFGAAREHLSEGAVESVTADDHDAVVVVSYVLAGDRHESKLTLSHREGRWVPNSASAIGRVQFAVPVSIDDMVLSSEKKALLLPAVYDVSATPTSFLDGGATIEVLTGGTQDVDVDATLRPAATDTAQTQLDEYLETCTRTAAEVPEFCGIAVPWAADFSAVSEIRYRIEQTPIISLTPSDFQADGGALVATVTGTALDGSAQTLTYRTTNWGVRGDVTFTAEDIVLSVW